MDINYTPAELEFREQVRAFVRAELPTDIAAKVRLGKHLSKDDHQRWQRILVKRGWYAANWPVEHGGTGWSVVQKHIFEEECAAHGAPRLISFGVNMVAPVIIKFGTQAQKDYYLPRILSGEDWWCQGYSEPGAGSDLAALSTRAERRGDIYVVNGQKTWTTLAQYANWIFCLVRTDPGAKKQEGISFLLIDMTSPGVTVRPITLLDGSREVNEVFFDGVEVPVANRVGADNQGWNIAKYLLEHERTSIAGVGLSKRELALAKAAAAASQGGGAPQAVAPGFAARLAQVEIDLLALEILNLRVLDAARARGHPGPQASMLKIKGSEITQRISELALEASGATALPAERGDGGWRPAPATAAYLNLRKVTIYGGSNEIQRSIIAKHLLDL